MMNWYLLIATVVLGAATALPAQEVGPDVRMKLAVDHAQRSLSRLDTEAEHARAVITRTRSTIERLKDPQMNPHLSVSARRALIRAHENMIAAWERSIELKHERQELYRAQIAAGGDLPRPAYQKLTYAWGPQNDLTEAQLRLAEARVQYIQLKSRLSTPASRAAKAQDRQRDQMMLEQVELNQEVWTLRVKACELDIRAKQLAQQLHEADDDPR